MLLRNNGTANPKCNNVSAVCKSVNATKNTLALLCYAWVSKIRRQRGNRHKSKITTGICQALRFCIFCIRPKEKEESKKIKRELKARKMRNCKLKYYLSSSVGILSYVEGSKTTRSQDTLTDSWVENDGFLMYGKTPCKKVTHSYEKVTHS